MIVSSRGDAAQISSTLMRPRAVSIWASMPMWPTGRPALRLDLGEQQVEGDDLGRGLHLRQHDLVEALAGVADDLDHVERGPLRVPGVDADAEDLVAPVLVLDGVDDLGASRLLLQRRHGVLEVEEHHVGGDRRALGQHLLAGAGDGEAGAAGQVRVRADMAWPKRRCRYCSRCGNATGRVPGDLRRLGVVDLGAGVVEEGVVDVLVDEELDVLAAGPRSVVLEPSAIAGVKKSSSSAKWPSTLARASTSRAGPTARG